MYAGVPSATPADGELLGRSEASVTALATPKSMTIAWRPESSTFSGLMSRWTTPARCAVASASAISPSSRTASGTGSSPLAGQPVAQRLALDVGHHVVEEAVGVAGVEHAEDVGMLEPGGDLDLAGEPVGAERGGQLGAQHLDRHLAVVLQVLGEVDGGHAALAELALDAVAVGEGRLQSGYRLGHRGLWMWWVGGRWGNRVQG